MFDVEDDCMAAVAFRKFDCGNAIDLPFCWGYAPGCMDMSSCASDGTYDASGLRWLSGVVLFDVEDDCMAAVAFRKFDCGNVIDLPFCWGAPLGWPPTLLYTPF